MGKKSEEIRPKVMIYINFVSRSEKNYALLLGECRGSSILPLEFSTESQFLYGYLNVKIILIHWQLA